MTVEGLLSKENLLFLAIYGIIFLSVIIICFIILRSFIRFVIKIFKRIFHKNERYKKIGLDSGSDIDVVVKELQESKEERQKLEQVASAKAAIFGPTVKTGNILSKKEPEASQEQSFEDKNKKEIEEGLSKLKGEATEEEFMKKVIIPRQKVASEGFSSKEQTLDDKVKTIKTETEKEKENSEESIEESFNKFKERHAEEKETLESKMPSRVDENVNRVRRIEQQTPVKGEEAGKYSIKDKDVSLGKMGTMTSGESIFRAIDSKPAETPSKQETSFFEKPNFINDSISPNSAHKTPLERSKVNSLKDTSIFEGKEEVSRVNLRQKLRSSKLYEAEKSVGLTLSPVERAKLVKEVFSQNLGQNISKTDLRWGLKKLNEKMVGSKNMAEKGKIRKEIKFFKKIGGIK